MEIQLKLLKAVAPDLIGEIKKRYQILRSIYWMQPVGRRTLAEALGVTERILRKETDTLKSLQLVTASKSGMSLTEKGLKLVHELTPVIDSLSEREETEQHLAKFLGNRQCIVLSEDGDERPQIFERFGQTVTELLDKSLPLGRNVIAVMGGTTMAQLAKNMGDLTHPGRFNMFVPARGGIGEAIDIQANAVSATMALKTGGTHRALYVPEHVSPETYESLLHEPSIEEVLFLIDSANCVIHSIGRALHMAARRHMSPKIIAALKKDGAVSESFGYFFDAKGKVVYKIPRIGLQLEDLKKIPLVVAVAGGKSKALAIKAYMKNAPKHTILVTDEGAAKEILKGTTL
ncbi:sugar-binding domain-containing protein [Enterococcus hirae]|nr:SorC family transcriptional regulator [Enterococcaceae bacterium]MCI1920274.1 SorC family transcriptional regulator [Enterococcaceae bacterium]MDM8213312.1 sugar-binding domain-containing protein [Enterococcus hirae]